MSMILREINCKENYRVIWKSSNKNNRNKVKSRGQPLKIKEVTLQNHSFVKIFEYTSFINLEIWPSKPLGFRNISRKKYAVRVEEVKLISHKKSSFLFIQIPFHNNFTYFIWIIFNHIEILMQNLDGKEHRKILQLIFKKYN